MTDIVEQWLPESRQRLGPNSAQVLRKLEVNIIASLIRRSKAALDCCCRVARPIKCSRLDANIPSKEHQCLSCKSA